MSDYTIRYVSAVRHLEQWLRSEAKRSREQKFQATAREFERVADQLASFSFVPRGPANAHDIDGYERASGDLEHWVHLEALDARGTQRGIRLEWIARAIAGRAFRPG